jgi:hypothetical protein
MTKSTTPTKDIVNILNSHLGKGFITNLDDTTDNLVISIKNLRGYAGKEVVSVIEAENYYRNLANACSALSTLCNDRNLCALYNSKVSKFIFADAPLVK